MIRLFRVGQITQCTGKPKNACKWVQIGPKPLAVVFKSLLF